MKMSPRCFDCLLSRVEYESRLSTPDEDRVRAVLSSCRELLECTFSPDMPAPKIAAAVHRRAYELLGDPDPYRGLKEICNREATFVADRVSHGLHTFHDLVLASIIANTFDYGVQSHQVTDDFLAFFSEQFRRGLTLDDTDQMRERLDRVVYFTDNCGEIVFDRFLIQHLKENGAHVTLAVKGAPILNDATLEDAIALGMDQRVDRLTTTGSGDIGINLEKAPRELSEALGTATLVIAKGMANYESLSEYRDLPPTAYLMAVKCETIAESVGVPKGSLIARLCYT
jgi:damage-control phosphatase, subfamily I